MIENNAKGWHGSYSVVGRISAEKFHIILMKDEIIEEKNRRKKVNSFLFPSDSFEKNNKLKNPEEEVDIFEEIPNKKKSKKLKKENKDSFCSKKINLEIYRAHHLHHLEIERQIRKLKNHQYLFVNSMKYNPKMDLIWKRIISGPKWNTISGRERMNTLNYKQKKININNESIKNVKFKTKGKRINLKEQIKNKNYFSNKDISHSLTNTINMNKQTARGDLPIYYDHRIRNVKPFIIKNLKKVNIKMNDKGIKKPKKLKNNLRISLSNSNFKNLFHSKSTKIYNPSKKLSNNNNLSLKTTPSQDMKGINFSKTISRDQLNFIHRDREGFRPFFMPNYEFVEPRSVSMVSYTKKSSKKSNINRISGVEPNLFFDPIKVINKYNNHIETSTPNFKLMVSRGMDNSPLPSYMINKFDRNSLESITEKGLLMNCYLNSKFNKKFSTFYPKKSFNRLVNNKYLQDEKFSQKCMNYIVKECFNNKKLRKYIEYYNKDVDYYLEQNNLKRNFDGVTFSTYKENVKKNKDKEFYEKCFNDRYNIMSTNI